MEGPCLSPGLEVLEVRRRQDGKVDGYLMKVYTEQ
jgi:hypothetical protein